MSASGLEDKFQKLMEKDFEGISEAISGEDGFANQMRAILQGYMKSGTGTLGMREQNLQGRIREAIRLAALFEELVRDEPGWEVTAPRPFSLVCFRREGSDEANEMLLERVNASGEIFISHTKLNDRYVLRLAIGNERTAEEDVRRAWDVLRDLGKSAITPA